MRDQLMRDGFVHGGTISFAFPIFAWNIDLEVQHEVGLTASERTVLRLAGEGLGTTGALARAMGFGNDERLVASTATRLLETGGLAIEDGRLGLKPAGQAMLASARLARRERVTETAYYHPLDRRWSWNKPQRPPNEVEWTIELATPAPPAERRDEIRDLVRMHGVPELSARSTKGQNLPMELIGLQELTRSITYERVEIEHWRSADGSRPAYLGVRDGELDELLTRMIEGSSFQRKRRRLVVRAAPMPPR